jgi:hypothetical protein
MKVKVPFFVSETEVICINPNVVTCKRLSFCDLTHPLDPDY